MASSSTSQNMNTLPDKRDAKEGSEYGPARIVIFHLSVVVPNGSSGNREICHIAAQCKENKFQEYLVPYNKSIVVKRNNRLKIVNNDNCRRKRTYYGKPVNAVSPKAGLENFLNFLSNLTGKTCKILLAAHSCKTFHRQSIVYHMKQYNLFDTFKSLVLGFIDTVDVFKAILPEMESYKLKTLVGNCLNKYNTIPDKKDVTYAKSYVDILVSLLEANNCSDAVMKEYVNNLDGELMQDIDLRYNFRTVKKHCKDEDMTGTIIKNILKAGITIKMLKNAYRRDPDDGISKLLQEQSQLKMMKKTIKKINDNVKELCHKDDNTASNGTA